MAFIFKAHNLKGCILASNNSTLANVRFVLKHHTVNCALLHSLSAKIFLTSELLGSRAPNHCMEAGELNPSLGA